MELASPTASLLPRATADVLRVLERTGQPLSGRTITELAGSGVNQTRVSRLLRGLVVGGIVHQVPGGYVLNREHVAYEGIVALLGLGDKLLARISEEVALWKVPAESVTLFGSVARGQADVSSDIDLLVVRPDAVGEDDPQWADQVARVAERVCELSGNRCEVLEYSPAELHALRSEREPLLDSLLADGRTLHGRTVAELIDAS
ncbi:MAG: hypothetical protein QOJ66_363 [Ilumatobacteraceae bacterium]